MHVFFDLQTMSEPVLPYWSVDGVHLNAVWYDVIIRHVMGMLCAGMSYA